MKNPFYEMTQEIKQEVIKQSKYINLLQYENDFKDDLTLEGYLSWFLRNNLYLKKLEDYSPDEQVQKYIDEYNVHLNNNTHIEFLTDVFVKMMGEDYILTKMKFYHINKQDELRYFGTFKNYLEAYKAHPRWKEMQAYGKKEYKQNPKGTNMYSDPGEYFIMVDEDLEIGLISEKDIVPEFTIVD